MHEATEPAPRRKPRLVVLSAKVPPATRQLVEAAAVHARARTVSEYVRRVVERAALDEFTRDRGSS